MQKYEITEKEMPCEYGENRIYGKVYIPETDKEKLPVMILSHGYNGTGESMADFARGLAECGVITYHYDFCGGSNYSKSSGNSLNMSIYTETEDLKAVVKMLDGIDNTGDIYLYGESQGGLVSSLVAADLNEEIAGLLLLYPAFCIPDDWHGKWADEALWKDNKIDVMGMMLSRKFYDELPEYDVFEHIKKFKKPTVIFQGGKDVIVSEGYAQKAKDSFENAELVMYPEEGHGFSPTARQDVFERIKMYFADKLS